MIAVRYEIESSNGHKHQNIKEVASMRDWDLFNLALHHGKAVVVDTRLTQSK